MFKRSAEKLSALLLAGKPGVVVSVNAEKARFPFFVWAAGSPRAPRRAALTRARASPPPQPRKGAFVVRVQGKEAPLVSLLVRRSSAMRMRTLTPLLCAWLALRRLMPNALARQALPRPFAALRALDLEATAAEVLAAL